MSFAKAVLANAHDAAEAAETALFEARRETQPGICSRMVAGHEDTMLGGTLGARKRKQQVESKD